MSEAQGEERSAGSGVMRRWVVPWAIVWAGIMLSAFVMEQRLPEAVQSDPSGGVAALLLGVPALSVVVLLALRRLDRDPASQSAVGDAILAWLLAAMFASHALLLAVVTGALPSLHPGLALIAGFLLLGWAALLPSLPPGSPLGLLTRATRADPRLWRRVHREVAIGAALSGGLALASALVSATLVSALALIPLVVSLARGLAHEAPPPPDEDARAAARPKPRDEEEGAA